MPPPECLDQQEVSDIRASDQEHEAHHRQRNRERWEQGARIVEGSLPQGEQSHASAAVGRRIIVLQSAGHRGYLRLRLLPGHARLEPGETLYPRRSAVFELVSVTSESFLHGYWHPE